MDEFVYLPLKPHCVCQFRYTSIGNGKKIDDHTDKMFLYQQFCYINMTRTMHIATKMTLFNSDISLFV